jgi:transcriptional regulator with AAA-type ATPase domain/tetratricopeptide (TPR) repeat protein
MAALSDLLGDSPAVEAVRREIRRLLASPLSGRRLPSVLIQGETGTGKGLVARILHSGGPRAEGPFVDVNCAAIPETLLEAELFGFEKGAFTDARRSKPGLFQSAHHGAIFLDEIGLLPEALQAKLLSVLEDRSVRRLGATRAEPVDLWVLSATNADLRGAVRERRFREDLYHRLAVLTLTLPPLRARGADILRLAERFLVRACQEYGLPAKRLSPDAEARMLAHPWPGNVRELGNVMERVALLSEGDVVTADVLDLDGSTEGAPAAPAPGGSALSAEDAAREHLRATLEQTGWNITRTATALGLSRNTVRARIERYGLAQADSRAARAPRSSAPAPFPSATASVTPLDVEPTLGRSTIRWERRSVTFLRVALMLPPGEDQPDTSRALEVIVDKIRTFGGRMEDLGQTALEATFGLEPIEDAPRRAANAALAIANAAGATGGGWPVVVALHVGGALVGHVSGTTEIDRADRRAVSDVLDGLVAGAEVGAIMVSGPSRSLLDRRFQLEAIGAVDGRSRLRGRGGSGLALWGRLERFIGRAREMELLGARWAAAARGNGQIAGVVGEPGVGKSRLLWEFARLRAAEARILQAAAVALGTPTPYAAVIELLRDCLGLEPGDDAERARAKVVEHVHELDEAFVPIVPPLLALLDVASDDEAWAALDPAQRRQQMLDSAKALLLRESRRRPLLVVIEDAHWLDSESQALLQTLADGIPTAAVLLALTYRPEYRHPWGTRSYYTQIRVDVLESEPAEDLVRGLVGEDASLSDLHRRLVHWTGGNPLFLEETVRSLVETGALRGERGDYRLDGSIQRLEVPGSVTEVLAGRIDRLEESDRAVLQCAAVIGRDVPHAVLAAADGPEESLRPALGRLRDAEFLYERSVYPASEYTFKHALTQAVAYQGVPEAQRRTMHARAAEAIERLFAGRLDEHVDRLAHHAFEGHRWARAVEYSRAAGERAFARFANREAATYFEHALTALAHAPESRQTLEQGVDLRLALRNALTPLGDAARTLERLREARELAHRLEDTHRLSRTLAFESNALYLLGEFTQALDAGRQAQALGAGLGDLALDTAVGMYRGRALVALGQYGEAVTTLAPIVAVLSGDRARERLGLPVLPAVFARSHLVSALVEQGRFAEAERHAAEALAIAEAAQHPDTLFWGWLTVGLVPLTRGAVDATLDPLEQAVAVCRTHDLPIYEPFAASAVALAQALGGRPAEAVATLRPIVEQGRRRRQALSLGQYLVRLGEASILAGWSAEARLAADEAVDLARHHAMRGMEAHALRLRAESAQRGAPAAREPADDYGDALVIARALDMPPLEARCLLGLGSLAAARGDRDAARGQLGTAAQQFTALAMPYWLAQARAQLEALA